MFNDTQEFKRLIDSIVDDEVKKCNVASDIHRIECLNEYVKARLCASRKYLNNINHYKSKNPSLSTHNIISLGDNCLPRNLLTKYGFKKSKAEGELSFPFDLAIHPINTVRKLIENNFADYLTPNNYSIEYGHPVHKELGIMFNHERGEFFSDNNYQNLITRYVDRANNFNHAIDSRPSIFILHCKKTDGINALIKCLKNRLILKNNHLVIVNTGYLSTLENEVDTQSDDTITIHYVNAPFPYDKYVWFSVEDYTSDEGINFEKSIIDNIEYIFSEVNQKYTQRDFSFSLSQTALNVSNDDCLQYIIRNIDTDIISKIKKDSQFDGFNAYLKVCDILDDALLKHIKIISSIDIEQLNEQALFNFSFIFQRSFIKCKNNYNILLNLPIGSFKRLLCRKELAFFISEGVLRNNLDNVESIKLLFTAFAATAHSLYNDEMVFLSTICNALSKRQDELSLLIHSLIIKRINAITEFHNSHNLPDKDARIALIITGQLRGYLDALPSLAKKFSDLSKVDVFISTWKRIGMTTFSTERLERIFDSDLILSLKNSGNIHQAEEIYKNHCNLSGQIDAVNLQKQLYNIFPGVRSININIEDDFVTPYCEMSNPEKMYYHNAFWVKNSDVFKKNKYSLVIKTRPDLHFPKSTMSFNELDPSNHIFTEDSNGWIYREWGFGVGDQLIYGNAELMMGILNLHEVDSIYSKITRLLSSSGTTYLGHINCGVFAWANAYKCSPTEIKPDKLCTSKKITLKEVNDGFTKTSH